MSEELSEILNVLAERFGTTIDHLYGVMIKQAYIYGMSLIVIYALCIFAGIWFIRYIKKMSETKSIEDVFMDNPFVFIGSALGLVVIVVMITMLPDLVTMLFNPEYWVLKQILGAFN